MAAAIIPLAGMVGGGIDISRMYIVKTRLQHACDAGALAGRKSMGGGTWSQTVDGVANYPQVTAGQFFDSNYNSAAYGATSVTKTFTENAGKVTGSASAVLPMTLMRIFGRNSETLSVTCDAEMRLPNTDVMFVLDVTGSMGDPQPGDTVTKMVALKTAVKCFYEIVARLDTDANCTTGAPSGGTGNQVQIRFGFVPYDQNVNVGRLLKPEWFADSWNYQTRQANWTPPGTTTNGPYWETYGSSISQGNCLKFMNNQSFSGFSPTPTSSGTSPSPTTTVVFNSDGAASSNGSEAEWGWNGANDDSGDNRSCRRKRTDTTTTYVPTFKDWNYGELPVTVSLLKSGTSWNNNFQWAVGSNGANKTITWDGCIEERKTASHTDYDPIPSDAYDLDIDTVPTSNADTKWGMALPGLTYTRKSFSSGNNTNGWSRDPVNGTTDNYGQGANYTCPVTAKKLQAWPNATDFDNYVDLLQPGGNTYHDTGLVWGARLMSPTGLFASENAYTPGGGDIERHMIFMTDGDACTDLENYTSHGVDWYKPVTLPSGTTPSEGCTSTGNLTQQINLRTEGLCTAIKNMKITLWVIAFGNLASSTETRLTNCATSGRYFKATNAAELQNTFKKIADQISQLRLTK